MGCIASVLPYMNIEKCLHSFSVSTCHLLALSGLLSGYFFILYVGFLFYFLSGLVFGTWGNQKQY